MISISEKLCKDEEFKTKEDTWSLIYFFIVLNTNIYNTGIITYLLDIWENRFFDKEYKKYKFSYMIPSIVLQKCNL